MSNHKRSSIRLVLGVAEHIVPWETVLHTDIDYAEPGGVARGISCRADETPVRLVAPSGRLVRSLRKVGDRPLRRNLVLGLELLSCHVESRQLCVLSHSNSKPKTRWTRNVVISLPRLIQPPRGARRICEAYTLLAANESGHKSACLWSVAYLGFHFGGGGGENIFGNMGVFETVQF